MSFPVFRLVALAALALLAPGCCCDRDDGAATASSAHVATADSGGSIPAAPLTGDVLGLPVEVVRKDPALVPVGETGAVEVIVRPIHPVDAVRVELTGDKGLEVLDRQRVFEVGPLSGDASFVRSVEVRPTRPGLHHLKVLVMGLRDGKELGRTGVVPVLTGEGDERAALETPGRVVVAPDGRRILEMPVDGEPPTSPADAEPAGERR